MANGFSVSTRHKDSTCASRCGAVRAMPTSPIALPERGAGARTAAPRSASILKIARRCTASRDYELIHSAKCILEEGNSDDYLPRTMLTKITVVGAGNVGATT